MAHIEIKRGGAVRTAWHAPPFRTYMGGSLIASIGDWIDMTVLNWAVLQMTDSPLALAVINACRLVPIFLLSLFAGVLADRFDRRRLLIVLVSLIALLTIGIGWLFAVDAPFWLFAVAVTLRSVLQAMDPPVRNSFLPALVPQDVMANALALNTAVMNLARIIGPAIAGFALQVVSPEHLFHFVAASFAIEVLALAMIGRHQAREPQQQATPPRKKAGKATVREALLYIKQSRSVQSLLLLAVVPMVFGFPYTSMLPLFAQELMQLGPEGFGALLSVSAVGALLGSLLLSATTTERAAGRWLILSLLGFGASLTLFMVAGSFLGAAVAMFVVGFTSQTYRTMSRIMVQVQVPDHLRGRIMSIALMDRGLIPLGALLVGSVATSFGTLTGGLLMGGGCLLFTLLLLAFRRSVWHL